MIWNVATDYMTPGIERWRARTDGPLIVLAIGSLPLLLLELARDELTAGDRLFLDIVNLVVFVAFLVNYVVEIALASNRRAYVRHEWLSALIVLAQGFALLPALSVFGVLRGARAVRLVRIIAVMGRLLAIGGITARDGRAMLRRHAASIALGVAGLTWLTAAVGFTMVENVGEGQRLNSFFDALWWSTTTITTVGYGDLYPVTAGGRVIAGMTMVVGISTFGVVTAKVASFLIRDDPPE